MNVLRTFVIVAIAFCAAAAGLPQFAAVSIHRQAPDDSSFFVRPPGNGHFSATGCVARLIVMLAYDVQESQIAGGPAWFTTERFAVEAKSDDGQPHTTAETREMLQNMLADRFRMRMHREMREGPAYVLTIAKNGSKLKPAGDSQFSNVRVNGNSIQIEGATLSRMTQLLSGILGRPVVDRTGLPGSYNASLTWGDAPNTNGDVIGSAGPAIADPNRESIFSAIQDQLGLNLVSQRASIDTIVIDSMEMPSAN